MKWTLPVEIRGISTACIYFHSFTLFLSCDIMHCNNIILLFASCRWQKCKDSHHRVNWIYIPRASMTQTSTRDQIFFGILKVRKILVRGSKGYDAFWNTLPKIFPHLSPLSHQWWGCEVFFCNLNIIKGKHSVKNIFCW